VALVFGGHLNVQKFYLNFSYFEIQLLHGADKNNKRNFFELIYSPKIPFEIFIL
jgi:hypothetical protein